MSDELERQQALRTIGLGMDAESFVRSTLGQHLIERAQEEAIEAVDRLKTIKRSEYTSSLSFEAAVLELQMKINRAENLELWLAECIDNGRNTERLLQDQEATD